MTDQEIMEACAGIAYEMLTLEPRLNEPFRGNVEACQAVAKNIQAEMEARIEKEKQHAD
tara:strand:- start:270 stop:446 length:177 start_codon:yes stop_codon:yes gene_type:complete